MSGYTTAQRCAGQIRKPVGAPALVAGCCWLCALAAAPGQAPEAGGLALPPVVVSASGSEQTAFDAVQNVTVIPRQEIDRRAAASTPDLLVRETGVLVQKTNLGGGSPFIRGLTGKHILLLVDGVRMNNSLYRYGPHQYLNTIDPNTIERIEIVRGAMSLLYGSDAMGGVINVVTRKRERFDAARETNGLLYGKYESAAEAPAGRAQLEGNVGRFGYVGGVTGRSFDDLEGGQGVGEQVPSAYDELDWDLKLNVPLAKGQEVVVASQYVRQYDVPKTSEVTLGDKLKFNYEPQRRSLNYVRYEGRDIGAAWLDLLRATVSYQTQEEGEQIVGSDPTKESIELTEADTLGLNLHMRSDLGRYSLISYGVEYDQDWVDSQKREVDRAGGRSVPARPTFPDDSTYQMLGAYVQDEIQFADRWVLIPGLRYSLIEADGELPAPPPGGSETLALDTDDWSGGGHLRFDVTDSVALIAGVIRGFRAPNMEDFFGKVDFARELPNTELEPETSMGYEAGLKVSEKRYAASLFLSQTHFDDLIDRVTVEAPGPDGVGGAAQRQNVGEAEIDAIEFSGLYSLDEHWALTATAAWTEGDNVTKAEPMRRIPPLQGSVGVRYAQGERWWCELYTLLADRQDRLAAGDISDPRIPEGGTPGYVVWNAAGGAVVARGWDLSLRLENITDEKYKTHGSGIYAPGLNLVCALRYCW